MESSELLEILLSASGSKEAIQRAYGLYRELHPRTSLAGVRRKLGALSKGSLSEILRGKRLLPMANRYALGELLGLSPAQVRYLALLVERDHAKAGTSLRRHLDRELGAARKALSARVFGRRSDLPVTDPLVFELFALFGLHRNRLSSKEIEAWFGRARAERAMAILKLLSERAIVAHEGDSFQVLESIGYLAGPDFEELNRGLIADGLSEASGKLAAFYLRANEAIFRSSFVSVQKLGYARALAELREKLSSWEAGAESGDADLLVRVNLQVYPLEPTGS